MSELLEFADALWAGAHTDRHPWWGANSLEALGDGLLFYSGFANLIARQTQDGLVIFDPGAKVNAHKKQRALRRVTDAPVHSIVLTHGHLDHVFGVEGYRKEAAAAGLPAPQVVAHQGVSARFARYRETAGYNGIVNQRQFYGGGGQARWPTDYPEITLSYADRLRLKVGGRVIDLHHARGETDDHSWAHLPDDDAIVCGDLFTWVSPNAGNPQKAQRYPGEWAQALRAMAALGVAMLLPGHGPPVVGAARVQTALSTTAEYLESLWTQAVDLMNEGAPLDSLLHSIKPPAALAGLPWLQPLYDEPEFIVRNLWRQLGGWYDGQPAHLKPAPEAQQGSEIAALAGGAEVLMARARALCESGDLRMACHLADWAWQASPDDEALRAGRASIYSRRAEAERSTMAIGLYRTVATQMGAPPAGNTLRANQKIENPSS